MAKILIIEDDAPIQHAYALKLKHDGHEVLLADNANQGMEQARQHQPDIILLDMMLPGISGLDLLRQINIRQTLPRTKLIVLSNIESESIVKQAKDLGADQYLLKLNYTPHQISQLIAKL